MHDTNHLRRGLVPQAHRVVSRATRGEGGEGGCVCVSGGGGLRGHGSGGLTVLSAAPLGGKGERESVCVIGGGGLRGHGSGALTVLSAAPLRTST